MFSSYAFIKCDLDDGFQLIFDSQVCVGKMNSQAQVQGCYLYTISKNGVILFEDEAARILEVEDEEIGGEEVYLTLRSIDSTEISSSFYLSTNTNQVSFINLSLFDQEKFGYCQ